MSDADTQGKRCKPKCPKCGSSEIREWALVPVAYPIDWIDAEGHFEIDLGADSEMADDGRFDELMCRACDHSSKDPLDFYPKEQDHKGSNA